MKSVLAIPGRESRLLPGDVKILRYYHTMRHLKTRQTLGRLFSEIKRNHRLYRLPEIPVELKVMLKARTPFLSHEAWNRRQRILKGEFTFLNVKKKFYNSIDWRSNELPQLWRFNLHYFNYLCILEEKEKVRICIDWIRNNPAGTPDAWHSYSLSLRIVNWCKQFFTDQCILKSLYLQAAYLYRNLETYHPGNHLLENARALIFAGLYFRGQGESEKWLRKGLDILSREIPVQVLDDGGYFERSTMYHAIMLEGFLDILNILPDDEETGYMIEDAVKKMSTFLKSMTHPDGGIALFNDSTLEIAPETEKLLSYAKVLTAHEPERISTFNNTGYYIHHGKQLYLVIDGGAVGPDYLPAHSHADIFSYELSINGRKFIVDSGVYEYPAGPMRSFVRSTRAHNTVAVDKKDQAECWDSFRVARRYLPQEVSFNVHECKSYFKGSFRGYASLIGDRIIHTREITTDEGEKKILFKDYISGKGNHLAESLIHINPEAEVKLNGNIAFISMGKDKIIVQVGNGTVSVEDGWYCPGFGVRITNKVLVISKEHLPAELSYSIRY